MWRKPRRSDQDFHDEIETHLQIEADRLTAEGMSRPEALAAARRGFGNVTRARERFHEAGRWLWLDHRRRDVRLALLRIVRAPVAAATVVLSLALGIGFNTAIFTLADQALVRALPVDRPEQLVLLDWHGSFVGGGVGSDNLQPHALFRELREEMLRRRDVFTDLFARHPTEIHLSTGREAESVSAELVSGSYFPSLGVRPALGRLLAEDDDREPDARPVAVLSYDYWRQSLGADPRIVGRRVLINNFPFTVVGVAGAGFHGVDWGAAPALWIPIMMQGQATPGWNALLDRRTRWLHVFGRLRPGVSREQARARLQPWFRSYLLADTRSAGWPPVTGAQMQEFITSTLDVLPGAQGRSDLRRLLREPLLILLSATALILLLACLNVANLSLAQALANSRATALQVALGASRWRIAAEQLIGSAVLAAAGCGAGVLAAPVVSRAILSFLPGGMARVALHAGLDLRILLFALAVTAIATVFSGTAPALYATSIQPTTALRRPPSAAMGGLGVRRALVVGQFVLALILLVGAGLFARTLAALRLQGPGYSTTNLLMFRLDPLADGYDEARAKPLMRRLLAAVRQLPGVEQAGLARVQMLDGGGWNNPVTVISRRRQVTEDLPMNAVTPGFFAALGTPVVRGRDLTERDADPGPAGSRRAAIVNEEFVRQYLEGEEPLGARLGIGDGPATAAGTEIVGVVRSFHDIDLRQPQAQIYFALWEGRVGSGTFYVRSRGASAEMARALRRLVHGTDPALAVLSLRTVDDQLDRLLTNERLLATLAAAFAAVATLLAMIGLYGVLSFSAACRTREIGIRLALGAPRRAAGGLIVREAAMLALAGIAIALPASWALGRLIASQLFGVEPLDPAILTGAAAILAFVCLAAGAVPAHRAGAVSPLETLRGE